MNPPADSPIARLLAIMARLRSPGGCPWDREQTLESLKPYAVEEVYEVLDAIDSGDPAKHCEELGDLLLQVVFQARLREEAGDFTFDDVARSIAEKLIRRHPHVFADALADTPEAVLQNWEKIKAGEKAAKRESFFDGIPRRLPALHKAQRVQSRASRVGFDWTAAHDVVAKIREELAETEEALATGDLRASAEEIGDLLFAVANLARFIKIDAEDALDGTTRKFMRRFEEVERRIEATGRALSACSLAELDAVWNEVKADERRPAGG